MNSITFGIGYLLAVLLVDVSSADNDYLFNVPKTTQYNSPYNFVYHKASQSLLIMEITLKNIPPSVTAAAVTVTQFRYGDYWDSYSLQKKMFEVNVDKMTREGKLMILPSLTLDQVWFDVQLHNAGGGLCYGTRIIEGRDMTPYNEAYYWDTTLNALVPYNYNNWEHDDSKVCFAPKACEIILDLIDTCIKEQRKSTYGETVECRIEKSQYICTFVRAETNKNELVLSQNYEDDSVIGPIWEIKKTKRKSSIKLELELFDNNTSVKLAPKWSQTITTIRSDTLSISGQDISKASDETTLKYTNTTDVSFNCEQHNIQSRYTKIYVWLGFINTTDNKITTHNTTIMKRKKFTMADNGTILCCIVYKSKKYEQEMTVTRFVKNKTLLIYQTQEPASTNLTESNEQKKAICHCHDVWWLYLFLTLLGTTTLLLTLYIVKKQRWCTKSQPAEETVELDNYATANQVLYANLDFVHNESRAENQTEESPYANIIGVLHPL